MLVYGLIVNIIIRLLMLCITYFLQKKEGVKKVSVRRTFKSGFKAIMMLIKQEVMSQNFLLRTEV